MAVATSGKKAEAQKRSRAAKKAAKTRAENKEREELNRQPGQPGPTYDERATGEAAKLADDKKTGADDFSVEYVDGARALLRLGKETRLVNQADLHNVSKQVSKAVQFTY